MKLPKTEIVKLIDISCVKANTTLEEIAEAAALAKEHNTQCVYALPAHTPYFAELLNDRKDILIGGAVGYPSGSVTTDMKVFGAKELLGMGAGELDMMINLTWLKARMYDRVEYDIKKVKDVIGSIPLKIILECDYLTDDEIICASEIGVACGVEWIKTGTGWAPNGTTTHQIKLISQAVQDKCLIKAAGGIKNKETLLEMYDLGVRRFGVGFKTAKEIIGDLLK